MSGMPRRPSLVGLVGVCWALLMAPSPAMGIEVHLVVKAFHKAMPDGTSVPVWGFARDADGDLSTDGGEAPSVPGPRIIVPPGDDTLVIHVRNDLPAEPGRHVSRAISIVLPGHPAPGAGAAGTPGAPAAVSPCSATAPVTCIATYRWNNVHPGTHLYQAATTVHTQMGLYGLVTKDVAEGTAYPGPGSGTRYDRDLVLFYSEIAPALNAMVARGAPLGAEPSGPTLATFKPRWFLVNGEPLSAERAPLFAGTAGEVILVRFVNAGRKTHVPLFLNAQVSQVAGDAKVSSSPRPQDHVLLQPGRTADLIWAAREVGTYLVYDRGHMPRVGNPRTTRSPHGHSHLPQLHATETGLPQGEGLLKLEVAANDASLKVNDLAYRLADDGSLKIPAPGVLRMAANDLPAGVTAVLVRGTTKGSLALNADGSFTYRSNPGSAGPDGFSFRARHGATYSEIVTVEISVVPRPAAGSPAPPARSHQHLDLHRH